jgi:hypothetical protein
MGFNRAAGLGALGFVAIVLGVNVVLEAGSPPDAGASSTDVAAYFSTNAATVQTGSAFAALAWLLIAIFGAGAYARIAPSERERSEAWSMVGVIGIAMLNVMFGAVTATRIALAAGDPATTTLWHLHNAFFTVNNVSLVVTLVGFSVGGVRTALLRPWHAALGLVSAALIFVSTVLGAFTAGGGPAGLSLVGFIGWLLWLAWLGTFGVLLIRDRIRPQAGSMVPVGHGPVRSESTV